MRKRLILPQHGLITPGMSNPMMDLDRAPVDHRCPRCNRQSVIIPPVGPGKLVWKCPCGMEGNLTWGHVPKDQKGGAGTVQLKRRPLLHECQDCGRHDWIALPDGGGDIRWECQCGSVWLIRFTPERWMLARVSAGAKPITEKPDTQNG